MDNSKSFGSDYIDRIKKIWILNAPPLGKYDSSRGLYKEFREQYEEARKLATWNLVFVKEQIIPLLDKKDVLSDEEERNIEELCENLIELEKLELTDWILCLKLREQLFLTAKYRNDRKKIISNTDVLVTLFYHLCDVFRRGDSPEACALQNKYKSVAVEYINYNKERLKPDAFCDLDDAEKLSAIGINKMESLLWYPQQGNIREIVHKRLTLALEALKLVRDPELRKKAPDFQWEKEVGVCLYYASICSSIIYIDDDIREDDMDVLYNICLEQLRRVHEGEEASCDESDANQMVSFMKYLRGEITPKQYIDIISVDYLKRDKEKYDFQGINENVYRAAQILEVLVRHMDLPGNIEYMERIYSDLVEYSLKMPNNQYKEIFLVYILISVDCFKEIDGGITFFELCNALLSNCSPSTYIHSQMVGKIAELIGTQMVETNPGLFLGLCDSKTIEDVRRNKDKIGELLYNCGLCHDIGKLPYLDVIDIIYRPLFMDEIDIIKLHSTAGYNLLRKYKSTSLYADVAYGHHKWYNNKKGYPEQYDRNSVEYPVLTDIIMVADCLDAATDIIFRGYNKGITLDDYIQEVKNAKGDRYSPDVAQAFDIPGVYEKLSEILTDGREQAYLKAYKCK